MSTLDIQKCGVRQAAWFQMPSRMPTNASREDEVLPRIHSTSAMLQNLRYATSYRIAVPPLVGRAPNCTGGRLSAAGVNNSCPVPHIRMPRLRTLRRAMMWGVTVASW